MWYGHGHIDCVQQFTIEKPNQWTMLNGSLSIAIISLITQWNCWALEWASIYCFLLSDNCAIVSCFLLAYNSIVASTCLFALAEELYTAPGVVSRCLWRVIMLCDFMLFSVPQNTFFTNFAMTLAFISTIYRETSQTLFSTHLAIITCLSKLNMWYDD